jgi:hypothetical protein
MKLKSIIFLLLFHGLFLNAQERDQFVKWGFSLHHTIALEKGLENSINPAIYCDVAIGHNDIYDASPLYFEFYWDYAIKSKKEVNTIAGGANLKKFISFGNSKRMLYLLGGGKITFIKNYEYRSDYSLNFGMGVSISPNLEFNSFYTHGLTNSYLSNDGQFVKTKSLSIGLKLFFQKNWWF